MKRMVTRLVMWSAGLAALSGPACAQVTPVFGLGPYRIADVIDPTHGAIAATTNAVAHGSAGLESPGLYSVAEPVTAAVVSSDQAYGYGQDDFLAAGQDRSWGITVGLDYGALSLRGAHQDRHVANVHPFDQTGMNFDAKNSIAAANYRLSWGTAYAAYSASRGWGNSPLYNPDNPYSANMAGTTSNDSRDMLTGVAIPVTRTTTFLASFIHKNDRELANRDANQLAFGAAYTLSRRTDFYAAYSHIKQVSGLAENGSVSGSAINIGMRHAF
jgi:predicted porin